MNMQVIIDPVDGFSLLAGSARCHRLPPGDTAFMCQSQLSCGHRGRAVPAATGYRRGIPRCGVNRNSAAGDAAVS